MSNQLVPAIYRRVIDDVVTNVRRDFDEHGVDEMILAELQRVRTTLACFAMPSLLTSISISAALWRSIACSRAQSWEQKLAASRAADFSSDARMAPYVRDLPPVGSSQAAPAASGPAAAGVSLHLWRRPIS